jgi:hypothetical protein
MKLNIHLRQPLVGGFVRVSEHLFEAHFTHIHDPLDFQFPSCAYVNEFLPDHTREHILEVSGAETICTVHPGACVYRPCGTLDAVVGVAFCSRKDNFDRAAGRKLALARAMLTYDYQLRTAIWAAYLTRTGIL